MSGEIERGILATRHVGHLCDICPTSSKLHIERERETEVVALLSRRNTKVGLEY